MGLSTFIARGNVLDLTALIVIGAAFGSVTTSLDDVLTPPLGYLIGRVDFQALVLRLNGEVIVRYGSFLNTLVNFVIALFAMFLVVRGVATVQNLRRKEMETEEAAEVLPLEAALLTETHGLLAAERSSAPPER